MILGAFMADISNNEYNKFATDLVKGHTIVLEYYEPNYVEGGVINIDKVIHGYINTFSDGLGQSGNCNIDINCIQGDDWCIERRAVSMILVNDNTGWCSGCLVNNTRQDLTPYYLTADHCLRGDENTWVFRFKYWSPTCNQGVEPHHYVSLLGASVRANWVGTDFALLELNTQPPSGFGVLYAGWDRTALTPISGAGIHHPRGDMMKISIFNGNISGIVNNQVSLWELQFTQGVTEPASSGSALFNQNRRIVGQLLGTFAANPISCNNQAGSALYGRFDVSWNGGGTSSTRLRDWLDPDNTGITTIGATSPTVFLINRTLMGTHNFAALEKIHIEGNVPTNGPLCQPSNIPFTAESGSNVHVKAKSIEIHPGTEFKLGSNVLIEATDIDCNDNLIDGDYVNLFCNSQVSMKMGRENSFSTKNDVDEKSFQNSEEISQHNITENIILYPNPNSGRFEIAFTNDEVKFSEIIIYDLTGKIVYETSRVSDNIIPIDICHLQMGTYIVQIIHDNNSHIKKIVINN